MVDIVRVHPKHIQVPDGRPAGRGSARELLAWIIIGGLVSSTLLARVVTPVRYRLWPPLLQA